MGGRLRLRNLPLPPDPVRGVFLSNISAIGSGGSYVKQEFEMYTPPPFKPDRAASLAFAQARGFGTICAWDGARPIASSLPFFLVYADDAAAGGAFHVARHNTLLKLAEWDSVLAAGCERGRCLRIGGLRYTSRDQVPTWLYQAVHLTGTVRRIVRRRTRSASRRAQRQVRRLARAQAAVDVVEDDGRTPRRP